MARENIDLGVRGNPQTGDDVNEAFGKVQNNFIELYDIKLESVQGGTNTTIDNTDPKNPIINVVATSAVVNTSDLNNDGSDSTSTYVESDELGSLALLNSITETQLTNNAVTNSKLADMPAFTIKGNNSANVADPLNLTTAQVRTLLNVQDGAAPNQSLSLVGTDLTISGGNTVTLPSTGGGITLLSIPTDGNTTAGVTSNGIFDALTNINAYVATGNIAADKIQGATFLSRTNHTGTQLANTISDFQTSVTNNTSVLANTAKVGITTSQANAIVTNTAKPTQAFNDGRYLNILGVAANSNLLLGKTLSASGNRFDVVPFVAPDGVMEIGKFIDFHDTDSNTSDLSLRLESSSGNLLIDGSKVWTEGNDGSNSGLNADLLDGLDSSQFLRKDISQTLTGDFTATNNITAGGDIFGGEVFRLTGPNPQIDFNNGSSRLFFRGGNDLFLRYDGINDGKMWHSGNDGSDSGLDADLVRGQVPLFSIADNSITNAKIVSSTINLDRLSATGTRNSTTVLHGDNTWKPISSTPNPSYNSLSLTINNSDYTIVTNTSFYYRIFDLVSVRVYLEVSKTGNNNLGASNPPFQIQGLPSAKENINDGVFLYQGNHLYFPVHLRNLKPLYGPNYTTTFQDRVTSFAVSILTGYASILINNAPNTTGSDVFGVNFNATRMTGLQQNNVNGNPNYFTIEFNATYITD